MAKRIFSLAAACLLGFMLLPTANKAAQPVSTPDTQESTSAEAEKNEQALALLQENKTRFSQENLDIVPGAAPQACEALPAPTHVFLGGTSGNLPEILALILHKNPHARIVATAVTLESAAALTGCMKNFKSADCISMQVSKASAAGSYHLMKAQNPVWIFTLQNGGACS